MEVSKIVGCIMVIVSSTAMGFFFSNELKCRIEDLKELRKLIVLLRGDIRYANTPLPEAISAIARRQNRNFEEFLTGIYTRLNELSGLTFAEVWKDAVENKLKNTSLSKMDKTNLAHFGENMGYLDKDMQMNTLDLYISQLEVEIEELSKSVKEKSYLCNGLGVMAGIFISIIML